jgi:uncharacterized membrane protein AbrB (regulator of aidB expression)
MEMLFPLFGAMAIYAYWRYAMPFMRRPILVSDYFFFRHSPFFVMLFGGIVMNAPIFFPVSKFILPIIISACAIMIFAFLLPYIFNKKEEKSSGRHPVQDIDP